MGVTLVDVSCSMLFPADKEQEKLYQRTRRDWVKALDYWRTTKAESFSSARGPI
jgi:hypothetical protein